MRSISRSSARGARRTPGRSAVVRRLGLAILLSAFSGIGDFVHSASAAESTRQQSHQKERSKQIDEIIRKALEMRRQGKDRDALTELQKAAVIERQPRVAAQIGLAEQALGLWVMGERDLKEGLSHTSDPWIKEHRATLEEALSFISKHLGNLDVWGPPVGAVLFLDGEIFATFPLTGPVRVPVGRLEMEVKADGYLTSARPLEIKTGENVREHVVLRTIAPSPVVNSASRGGVAMAPTEPSVAPDLRLAPESPPISGVAEKATIFSRWWFWTAAAVVLVGVGTGTYLALSKTNDCQNSSTNRCTTFTP